MINLETIKTNIEQQLDRTDTDVVILNRMEASVIYGILVTMLSRSAPARSLTPEVPAS